MGAHQFKKTRMQIDRCPSDAELLSLHSSPTEGRGHSEKAKHVAFREHCQSKLIEINSGGHAKPALYEAFTYIGESGVAKEGLLGARETLHESVAAAAS